MKNVQKFARMVTGAENKYYVAPAGGGFFELRQTRFKGRAKKHPHDVMAIGNSLDQLLQTVQGLGQDAIKAVEDYKKRGASARTAKINMKDYKFWVVADGKIQSGWEYKEDAQDGLEDHPKGKVLTRQGLKSKGLDPDNDAHWFTQG